MSAEGSLRLEHLATYVSPEPVDVRLDVVTNHACVGVFAPVFGTLGWFFRLVAPVLVFAQGIHTLVNHHLNRILRGGRQLGLRRRICFLLEGWAAISLLNVFLNFLSLVNVAADTLMFLWLMFCTISAMAVMILRFDVFSNLTLRGSGPSQYA